MGRKVIHGKIPFVRISENRRQSIVASDNHKARPCRLPKNIVVFSIITTTGRDARASVE